jgi:hypothetical protein
MAIDSTENNGALYVAFVSPNKLFIVWFQEWNQAFSSI